MKPRTAPKPDGIGTSDEAIKEIKRFGALQRYKPNMSDAAIFWQEQARVWGLPSEWDDRGLVRVVADANVVDWRTYLEAIGRIRMGLAESLDGSSLRCCC
jgi:hypothetical protein